MSFRLGFHLVQQDKLSVEQVDRATRRQQLLGGSLDTHLLELGWLDLQDLSQALLEAFETKAPPEEWTQHPSTQALAHIPSEWAEQFQIVPIHQDDKGIHLLASDNGTPPEEQPLSYWLDQPVHVYRVPELRLQQALHKLYALPLPKRFESLAQRFPIETLYQQSETIPTATKTSQPQEAKPTTNKRQEAKTEQAKPQKTTPSPNNSPPKTKTEETKDKQDAKAPKSRTNKASSSAKEDTPNVSAERLQQAQNKKESIETASEEKTAENEPKRKRTRPPQSKETKPNETKRASETETTKDADTETPQMPPPGSRRSAAKRTNKEKTPKKAGLSLPPLDRLRNAFRPTSEGDSTKENPTIPASEAKKTPTPKTEPLPVVQPQNNKPMDKTISDRDRPLSYPDTQPSINKKKKTANGIQKPAQPTNPVQANTEKGSVSTKSPTPAPSSAHQADVLQPVKTPTKRQETQPFVAAISTEEAAAASAPPQAPPSQVPATAPPSNVAHDNAATSLSIPQQQTPPPATHPPMTVAPGSAATQVRLPIANMNAHDAMTIPGLPAFPPLQGDAVPTLIPGANNVQTISEDQLANRINNMPRTPAPQDPNLMDRLQEYFETTNPTNQQERLQQLLPLGGSIIPSLLTFIPATEQLTDKNPESQERIARIVALCEQIGDPAVYRLLQILEKDDQQERMRALLILGEWLPSRAIAPLLQRLFSEKDAVIQRMVRNNLRGYRKRSEFHKLLQFLRDNLRSNDDHRLQKAIFFLGDLRIAEAVPDLIELLQHDSPTVRESTLFALRNLALQDFGNDLQGWKQWHQQHAQLDRKHWVVNALNHEEKPIRHLAKEELIVEFGDDFGYNPKGTPAEREAVQKLAGLWLQKG